MKISTILLSTIAMTIAPTAYLFGLFYHQGILNAYGVDSDHFPLSITDSYVYAFYFFYEKNIDMVLWLIKAFKFLGNHWILIITCVLALIMILSWIIRLSGKLKIPSPPLDKFNNFLMNNLEIKIVKILAYTLSPVFTCVYFAFVLMLLLCLLPYWAYHTGYDTTFANLTRFNKVGCIEKIGSSFNGCIKYTNKETNFSITGILIERNEKNIAIYDGFSSHIYLINNQDTIDRLATPRPI